MFSHEGRGAAVKRNPHWRGTDMKADMRLARADHTEGAAGDRVVQPNVEVTAVRYVLRFNGVSTESSRAKLLGNRLSGNVGGVKHFWSTLARALVKSAPFRSS